MLHDFCKNLSVTPDGHDSRRKNHVVATRRGDETWSNTEFTVWTLDPGFVLRWGFAGDGVAASWRWDGQSQAHSNDFRGSGNMALYRYAQYLMNSNDRAFVAIHKAGVPAPHSGVYRCEGCGHEVASIEGNPLPPENHHQHIRSQGAIRWRLVVCAQARISSETS